MKKQTQKTTFTKQQALDCCQGFSIHNTWPTTELLKILTDRESPFRTTIDDESDRISTEHRYAIIADVHCSDGNARIGYFCGGGDCALDDCTGIKTIEEWADGWDSDGDLPQYLAEQSEEES